MAGDDSKDAQGRRLKLAREQAGFRTATDGWNAVRAATKSQLTQTTYLQHENGTRSLRGQASQYAATFDVTPGWLVWGHQPPSWVEQSGGEADPLTNVKLAPEFLPVRYRVQAGLWMEDDAEASIEQIEHPVVAKPKYAQFPQWMELVIGDSANLRVPDGAYVHVVDWKALGRSPKTGMWVVAERVRDQGGVRERTIKQVEVKDGKVVLWPRSTNPKWNAPVDLGRGTRPGEEDVEAFIVGLVVGAYDPRFDV